MSFTASPGWRSSLRNEPSAGRRTSGALWIAALLHPYSLPARRLTWPMKRTKEQIEANRQKALRIKADKAAKSARDNQRTGPAAQTAAAPLGPVTNTVAAPSRAARPTPPAARDRPPSLPEAELFSANSLDNPRRDLDYQDFMHSPAWQPDHFPPHTLKLKLHQEVEIIKGRLAGSRCVVSYLSPSRILLEVTDPSTGEEHPLPRFVFETNDPCPWRRRQFPVRPVD